MKDLAGKLVLITGGGSGIGRLMALNLARLGARLALWDINGQALEKVLGELKFATGREHVGQVVDVSDKENVYARAVELTGLAGPVDVLINNAGVVSGRNYLECTDAQIERTMGVNTMALFWTTRAFLPDMIRRNTGHVVTIASAAGTVGVARLADYCASKWAAVGFDESLRMELKKTAPGVRTTVVCPFFIDTGMFHGVKTRFSLILPILKEDRVAEAIVRAIRRNRARLMMPPIVYTVPLLRVLPAPLFDWVATFLGINASMDHFTGRAGKEG